MIVVAALLLTIAVGALAWSVQRRLNAEQRQQLRNEAALSELRLATEIRAQIASGQTIAENVVEGGTSTVRAVHKGIASIPFGILESIPVTRDTTRIVRQIHDAISDSVYGGISATNKALHQAARSAVESSAKTRSTEELPKDSGDEPK